MFQHLKIRKYLERIQKQLNREDFIDLFLSTEVLGFSDSEMGEEEYSTLNNVLNQLYLEIESNKEFSLLILDETDYVFPYPLGWAKLHCFNNQAKGITLYFKGYAYKLFLNNIKKSVVLNVFEIQEPRNKEVIATNLGRGFV